MKNFFLKYKNSLQFISLVFLIIALTIFSFMFFSPVINAF